MDNDDGQANLISLIRRPQPIPTTPPQTTNDRATMENGNTAQGEGKDPSSFLSDIIGNPVTVKLNSGVIYKGE